MEVVVGLLILGAIGWGLFQAVKGIVRTARRHIPSRTPQIEHGQFAEQQRLRQQHEQLNRRARELQLAILRLDQDADPDFRRAAAAARDAREVPVNFRQQQCRRLRPLLVAHYIRCRNHGTDGELLLQSLIDLVEALGVSDFEADYIRQEAERRLEQRPAHTGQGTAQEFQVQLQRLQLEHDQRLQVIRSLTSLADDLREQLLEAEDRRFQQQLFGRDAV